MTSNPEPEDRCAFCGIAEGQTDVFANNDFLDARFGMPYETETTVAFPDGAPLTPGHVLVVPRDHYLSFARMDSRSQRDVLEHIRRIKSELERRYPDANPYYFEHGSCEADEATGCSTTHAHFHVLFEPDDLFDSWGSREAFTPYSSIRSAWAEMDESDYYLVGKFEGEVYGHKIVEHSSLKCRMYLRKLFADLSGRPSLSDYRRYTGENPTRDRLVDSPRDLFWTLRDIDEPKRVYELGH